MKKPKITWWKHPAMWTANELFYGVNNIILPKKIKENEKTYPYVSFVEGLIGGYLLAEFGKHIIHPTVVEPILEIGIYETAKICTAVTIGGPLVATIISPSSVRQYFRDFPVWGPGAAATLTGASLKGIEQLVNHSCLIY